MLFGEIADHYLLTSMGTVVQGIQFRQRLLDHKGEGSMFLKRKGVTCLPTQCHIPQGLNLQQHHCENLRSHTMHNLFGNV